MCRAKPAQEPTESVASPTPKRAVTQDELECAVQQAHLARDVYNRSLLIPKGSQGVPGWRDASQDPAALASLGLEKQDLQPGNGSSFRARLYVPDNPEASMPPQVVFRGTEPIGLKDWATNAKHIAGFKSDHHRRAAALGRKLLPDAQPHLVGHSLGGALASLAALASGKPATTFNAAGLHENELLSLSKDGKPVHGDVEIRGYHMAGEIVTSLQRNIGILPEPPGTSVSVPAPSLLNTRLTLHDINVVVSGLEKQAAPPSGTGTPLLHRERESTVLPFGYCQMTEARLKHTLDALAHEPSAERRSRMLERMETEALFVLKNASRPQEDGPGHKALRKKLGIELPDSLSQDQRNERLGQLKQGAAAVLQLLDRRQLLRQTSTPASPWPGASAAGSQTAPRA